MGLAVEKEKGEIVSIQFMRPKMGFIAINIV
jgi:hypothetical protein